MNPEHVRADVRARLVSEWVVKGGVSNNETHPLLFLRAAAGQEKEGWKGVAKGLGSERER